MNTATLSKAATPLFEQIKTSLRDAILSGELQPGQKLPSENELQKRFSVSRITIRQALASLQAEALVETFNGKGSYVTRPANTPRLGMITGFFDHMRSRGMSARGQTLSVRKSKAQAKLAALLKLPAGTPVTTITVLRLADDIPVVTGRLCMETSLAERLLKEDIEHHDVMTLLEARLNFRLESTHIQAGAAAAGQQRARLLQVTPDTPLLKMHFVPHDIQGRPLLFAEMFFRPDRFAYRAVIRR